MDERLQSRLDTEADKLGSYELARHRLGLPNDGDDDVPVHRPTEKPSTARGYRPTGRHTVEPSGRDISRDIANAGARPLTEADRATNRRGVAMARKLLEEAKPVEETLEEKKARQAADAAELRRKAAESWARFDA